MIIRSRIFHSFQMLLAIYFVITISTNLSSEIKINGKAPSITLRDINNKLIFCNRILKEKPILISFFFVDCKPCNIEIPELEALNKKYKNKIKMLLISIDKKGSEAVKPYINKMNIKIEVLLDKYSDVAKSFGVEKYPAVFIIGKDGIIKYKCMGYNENNIKQIEIIIKDMI